MSKFFRNKDVEYPSLIAVEFHRKWMNHIKRSLGSNCTFLQHMRKVVHGVDEEGRELPDEYFVVAAFNVDGEVKRIVFKIDGTIQDVDKENYTNLKKDLLSYARTEGII